MSPTYSTTMTRRNFARHLLTTSATLVALGSLGAAYALAVEPTHLSVEHIDVEIALTSGCEMLRIAQLSDIHVGAKNDPAYLRRVVALTNQLKPDVILLTGDYVTGSASYANECAYALAELSAPWGKFAILGNHDIWTDADYVALCLKNAGLELLRDQSTRLVLPHGNLWLIGIEDTGFMSTRSLDSFRPSWQHKLPILSKLIEPIPSDEPRLLLVHNPDFNEMLDDIAIDLALCGHTHGGQVRIPGLGSPIVPSCMGNKYAAGLVLGPSSPVYVNRGIGMSILPIRLNCRPEITLFNLHAPR